jgi:3-methyladenine DNA glycosylase AlkC
VAEPFKNLVNEAVVQRMAAKLRAAQPAFDERRFTSQALHDLHTLEMKARAMQICAALEATLPADFDAAAAMLLHAMDGPEGLDGWALWPLGEYVARHGQHDVQGSLAVLHRLTQRFTAEFAIRPFIVRHPQAVFDTLARWTRDPSEHVRRLVSEGSRPRLPWGLQLKALIADPSPTLPLLRSLQDDESEYVRRSVANHLNDIAKDHPALVAQWLETHLPGATKERRALLRHASRTLVKRGDARVLAAWGLGQTLRGTASLVVTPARVAVGGHVTLAVTLTSRAAKTQRLAIDYAVHHVKADGSTSPKVFKGWVLDLPARATLELQKRHSMKPVTTRRYHAGRHRVTLQVNGETLAEAAFMLRPA